MQKIGKAADFTKKCYPQKTSYKFGNILYVNTN